MLYIIFLVLIYSTDPPRHGVHHEKQFAASTSVTFDWSDLKTFGPAVKQPTEKRIYQLFFNNHHLTAENEIPGTTMYVTDGSHQCRSETFVLQIPSESDEVSLTVEGDEGLFLPSQIFIRPGMCLYH